MRAGLIIYGSLNSVSGGYLYDRQLVHYLQAQGDEVEIISLPWRSYGRHLGDNVSGELQRFMKYGGYDVLLQDELTHPSLFRLNATLRDRPASIVSIVHHLRCSESRPGWKNSVYRTVERRYLNTIDAYIFNSHTTRDVVDSLLSGERPSLVAYPGRDHFAPQMTAGAVASRAIEGPLRLLFVGNIIRRKGLHTVLDALTRLPTKVWTLDIVGDESLDPAYMAEIDQRIARLPAGARVLRHGRLDDDSLARQYAVAHVLVVPSSYEGFGIVYAEGFGYGLPAIATTSGATTELIEDGRNGFLIAPHDAEQLAQCLAVLQADRSRLADMAANALVRYESFPTWAESAERIRSFLLAEIARFKEET